jgi:xylulokinase
MLWADTRSAVLLDRYRDLEAGLRGRLANPLVAGMAGPSLLWLRDEEPEAYRAARWALQPKDWLRLRLTGDVLSEPSDASATLLYDLQADAWFRGRSSRLWACGPSLLPPLVASGSSAGTLAGKRPGFSDSRPGFRWPPALGDTAAALLGSGLLEAGSVQLTVGTGAQILSPRESPVPDPHLRTHLYRAAHDHPSGRYYSMAAMQNAGLALEWVLKVLGVSWEEAYRRPSQCRRVPGA